MIILFRTLYIVIWGIFYKVKESISPFQITFNYVHYMNYMNTERQNFFRNIE